MLNKNIMALIVASLFLFSAASAASSDELRSQFPLLHRFMGSETMEAASKGLAGSFEELFGSQRTYPKEASKLLIYLKNRPENELCQKEFNERPLPTARKDIYMIILQYFIVNGTTDFENDDNIKIFKEQILMVFVSNYIVNNSFENFNPEHDLLPNYVIANAYHEMLKEKTVDTRTLEKSGLNIDSKSIRDQEGYNMYTKEDDEATYNKHIVGLLAEKNKYMAEVIPFIHEYILFRKMKSEDFVKAAQFILEHIKTEGVRIPPENIVRDEIAVMIDLIISEGSLTKQNPFHFVKEIGLAVSEKAKIEQGSNKTLWPKIFDDILVYFDDRNSKTTTSHAKDLIRNYLDLSTTPQHEELSEFLITKYNREGMRSHPSVKKEELYYHKRETRDKAKLPFTFQLYAFKVIELSFCSDEDFITAGDLSFVITNFGPIFRNFYKKQLKILNNLQSILIVHAKDLQSRFQLYDGLYNAMIHSCAENVSVKLKNLKNDSYDSFEFFDAYLDSEQEANNKNPSAGLKKKELGFPMNLPVYYPFYKIANLAHNPLALIKNKISFKEFALEDDQLIHEFTLKLQVKEIIEIFRSKLFPDLGFNYQNLNKMPAHEDMLKHYGAYTRKRDLANRLTKDI